MRSDSQAVFAHSWTCFCWSKQLMFLTHPDPCALTSLVLFLHPLVVFQLPYLTARGVQHLQVSWQPRHQAVPTTFSRGRLGECLWDHLREFTWLSAGEKNLHTGKQRESTAVVNSFQVLHSLHLHRAFSVPDPCSCGGGALA